MATTEPPKPNKQKLLDKLLYGQYAMIYVTTSHSDLVIPQHLATQPSVPLKVSRFFRGPISLDDWGVTTELSFKGEPFTCKIPWAAIWAIASEDGALTAWPEDANEHVINELLKQIGAAATPPPARQLSAVKRVAEVEDSAASEQKADGNVTKLKTRPKLKLIK